MNVPKKLTSVIHLQHAQVMGEIQTIQAKFYDDMGTLLGIFKRSVFGINCRTTLFRLHQHCN